MSIACQKKGRKDRHAHTENFWTGLSACLSLVYVFIHPSSSRLSVYLSVCPCLFSNPPVCAAADLSTNLPIYRITRPSSCQLLTLAFSYSICSAIYLRSRSLTHCHPNFSRICSSLSLLTKHSVCQIMAFTFPACLLHFTVSLFLSLSLSLFLSSRTLSAHTHPWVTVPSLPASLPASRLSVRPSVIPFVRQCESVTLVCLACIIL